MQTLMTSDMADVCGLHMETCSLQTGCGKKEFCDEVRHKTWHRLILSV